MFAVSLLQIIADANFCRSLVTRVPWRLANVIQQLGAQRLHSRPAEQFIREVAHQAVVREDSIVAREIGYHGFGAAPLLSEALFSDEFVVIEYNPLGDFFHLGDKIDGPLMERFNSAAKRCYLCLIEEKHFYSAQVAFSIQSFYRSAFLSAGTYQVPGGDDFKLTYQMTNAVRLAGELANKLLAAAGPQQYDALFVVDIAVHRNDVLETLVEIVYEGIAGVSNKFSGVNDPFWTMTMDVMHDMFHAIGAQPDGLTPFQQRLALKLSRRMAVNMNGFYPAVCRVLLATVGPYQHAASQPNRTAFNILKDMLYIHLKTKLHSLAASKPKQLSHYLPPNVTYHPNRLTHTYGDGSRRVTDLSALSLHAFSLTSERLRRGLTVDEREAVKRL